MAAAADTVKKVALELGGKNPNIVFADADLEAALDFALTAVFLHSGQVCSAGARLRGRGVDPRRVRRRARPRAPSAIRLGGPFDDDAETGPLISAAHRDKVEAYVAAGVAEGAVLRCGGDAPDDPRAGRRLLLPADRARRLRQRACRVVQDESFGPVLTVETFTRRGRGGARSPTTASTASPARCGPRTPAGPSGSRPGCGWARSGSTTTTPTCRRPSGAATSSPASAASSAPPGLEEYRETKHVWHNVRPAPQHWFDGK